MPKKNINDLFIEAQQNKFAGMLGHIMFYFYDKNTSKFFDLNTNYAYSKDKKTFIAIEKREIKE